RAVAYRALHDCTDRPGGAGGCVFFLLPTPDPGARVAARAGRAPQRGVSPQGAVRGQAERLERRARLKRAARIGRGGRAEDRVSVRGHLPQPLPCAIHFRRRGAAAPGGPRLSSGRSRSLRSVPDEATGPAPHRRARDSGAELRGCTPDRLRRVAAQPTSRVHADPVALLLSEIGGEADAAALRLRRVHQGTDGLATLLELSLGVVIQVVACVVARQAVWSGCALSSCRSADDRLD